MGVQFKGGHALNSNGLNIVGNVVNDGQDWKRRRRSTRGGRLCLRGNTTSVCCQPLSRDLALAFVIGRPIPSIRARPETIPCNSILYKKFRLPTSPIVVGSLFFLLLRPFGRTPSFAQRPEERLEVKKKKKKRSRPVVGKKGKR